MSHYEKTEEEKYYDKVNAQYQKWKLDNPNTDPTEDDVGRVLAEKRDRANDAMVESLKRK